MRLTVLSTIAADDDDDDDDDVVIKADNVAIFRSGEMVLMVGLRRRKGDTGPYP